MGSNHIWRNQTQTSTVVWWRPLKIFRTRPRFPCGPTLQQVLRMMLLLFLDDIRAKRGNFIRPIDDSVARPIQTPRWFDTADSRAGPRYKTQRTSS